MNAHAKEERDGLAKMRAIMDGTTPYRGIAHLMKFRPIRIDEGDVAFEGELSEDLNNPMGFVHGGYAATLLDSAVGFAVASRLKRGQGFTTLELKVAYHRALTESSGPVRADGKVLTFGRRAAFAEGKLFDKDGRLCASATTTCLVFDK